jgi:hypothetical protein
MRLHVMRFFYPRLGTNEKMVMSSMQSYIDVLPFKRELKSLLEDTPLY